MSAGSVVVVVGGAVVAVGGSVESVGRVAEVGDVVGPSLDAQPARTMETNAQVIRRPLIGLSLVSARL